MNNKIYYKVTDTNKKSIWIKYDEFQTDLLKREDKLSLIVKYKVNEWTKPNIEGSCLFVFDDFIKARDFAQFCFNRERSPLLWECYARGIRKSDNIHSIISILDPDCTMELIKKWWKRRTQYSYNYNYQNKLDHTIMCNEVMLLKQITFTI